MLKTNSILYRLKVTINERFQVSNDRYQISLSSKFELGQFSTNIVLLNNLNGIEVVEFLLDLEYIESARLEKNGFINLSFKISYLLDEIENIDVYSNEKVYLEYVSANPTGPLHIGHIRGAVLGDTVGNFFEYLGGEVKREYFVNDAGNQIDNLLESVVIRCEEIRDGVKKELKPNCYPGEYVKDIAREVLLKFDELEKSQIKDFVVEFVLKDIFYNLRKIGIYHNSIVSEQSFFENNVEYQMKEGSYLYSEKKKEFSVKGVIQELKEHIFYGKLPRPKEDENWVDREQLLFKFENGVALQKANGEYTYFASELCYIKYKIQQGYDKYIIILGQDHVGYVNKYNAVFDIFANSHQINIVKLCAQVRYIENNEVKIMSKRAGVFATLNDVLELLSRNDLRYFLLQKREGTGIDFDLAEAKKENNLDYSINLYQKLKITGNRYELNDEERHVICKIHNWSNLVYMIYERLEMNLLINYLNEIVYLSNLALQKRNNEVMMKEVRKILDKLFKILAIEVI